MNSPTVAPTTACPMPTLRPPKIEGSAFGSLILMKVVSSFAPMDWTR